MVKKILLLSMLAAALGGSAYAWSAHKSSAHCPFPCPEGCPFKK
jgi:hypothetical protein